MRGHDTHAETSDVAHLNNPGSGPENPGGPDPTGPRRFRLHATTALLLVVILAVSLGAFVFTRSVRDDNEQRLLSAQAAELAQVVQSLGSQEQAPLASAAIVADHTNGLPAAFRSLVTGLSPAGQPVQGWALLTRQAGKVVPVATVGVDPSALAIITNPDPVATSRIAAAFRGQFEVVGIYGTGVTRRLAMAAGAPAGGAFVAYYEVPLVAAAASSGTSNAVGPGIGIGLYVGATPSAAGLVLATGKPVGTSVERTVNIGQVPISLVVWGEHPLSGSLAYNLPWLSLVFLLVGGLAVALMIEMNLRKRDAALHLVNKLDAALEQRDLADQQRSALEAQLRQAQRLEAIGQLAGGVAHDFNNLLAAIMSYADLVVDDLADHPARADIDEIRKAARRGGQLTSQLLQFGSQAAPTNDTIDLNAGIEELQRLLSRAIGEDIELTTELAPDIPLVAMGSGELEQLLMNLVVNARDAIDGSGSIVIGTEVANPAGDGARVRLSVTDTGAGMDPAVKSRIFEPFFTTKERGRGTGLGLATVYGIVVRAGGTVDVRSTPGQGTTFELTLPAAASAATDAAAPADTAEPQISSGGTILLVEDEDAVRRPTRRMLEKAGYQVIDVSDGTQAVAAFADAHVDLLVTDVIMPGGMNGKELADNLRQTDDHLAVLFMSGYSADLLARRGLEEGGPANLLSKPFSEASLLDAVASALRVPSAVAL
jgi:signal transduction histidine kinase/ActR/RegA family two-component response regulator